LALTAVLGEVREDGRARRARVLVVEDDSRMRGILEMLLGRHWDVEVAADGREALDKVRRHVPDLVLADLVLPKVDGYQLIRELRAQPRTRSVPIVVVSGLAEEADRMRALEVGATDFLVKPFSERELYLRVSAQIETTMLRESAVRSGADRLRAVLDGALDAVAVLDEDGRVKYWNPRAADTFGWTAEEAAGRSFAEVALAPGQGGAVPPAGGRAEVEGIRKDGARFPLELSVVATADGGPERTVFARDVGGQRAAEEERNRVIEESREVGRAKDEFLSLLSHELRTPLSAIVGWAHMLRTSELDDATRARAIETIDRNAKVQNQLIEDILDVSRIVAGKFHVDMRSVDLARVAQAASEAVARSAAAKGVELRVEIEPGLPPTVGDPERLQQLVWNLLTNAIRFTPAGGRVTLAVAQRGDAFEIDVSDNGAGIDPAFLPHIFERFRQGAAAGPRRPGGLGLGLSIVRHIVELHGGSIHARSDGPGQGAVFTIRLPAKDSAAGKVPPVGHERRDDLAASPRLDGLRVAVVDDEPDARELIAAVLQGRGAVVIPAASSKEAVALIREQRPDVLLSDISMRDEDGYELIRQVRGLPAAEGGRTPAAALTAYGRLEDRMKALGAGFQLHVAKPVDPAELVAVVASLGGRT
jgi:PAS domain S-box-containing protein